MRYSNKLRGRIYVKKFKDLYVLLKILVKTYAVNTIENVLIVPKNLIQIYLKISRSNR